MKSKKYYGKVNQATVTVVLHTSKKGLTRIIIT